MVFNANAYYANKYARRAWEQLAQVREIRERARRGEAYVWEVERMPRLVEMARGAMRLSISFRRLRELDRKGRIFRLTTG